MPTINEALEHAIALLDQVTTAGTFSEARDLAIHAQRILEDVEDALPRQAGFAEVDTDLDEEY